MKIEIWLLVLYIASFLTVGAIIYSYRNFKSYWYLGDVIRIVFFTVCPVINTVFILGFLYEWANEKVIWERKENKL